MTTAEEVDAFRDHELWAAVEEARQQISAKVPQSATDRHTAARADAVLSYLQGYRSIEPYLFPTDRENTAANLTSYARTLSSQFEGWSDDAAMLAPTVAQIDASGDAIMSLLSTSRWPSLQKESRAKAIRDSAESFRSASEASLDGIDTRITDAGKAVDAIALRVGELESDAEARATEAATALREIESALTSVGEDGAKAIEGAVGSISDTAIKNQTNWRERANSALEQLELDAETGKKLIAYISDDSMGGAYMKFAKREKWGYRLWIGAGIIVVSLTLLFFYTEFKDIDSLTPTAAIIKAGLSLTALGFAGFAFREAGKRHRQSVEARYRALDMVSLRPFTEGMEEKQQLEFRSLLGQRLFGAPVESLSAKGKTSEKVSTFRLEVDDVKRALDAIKTAKDLTD